MAGESLKKKPSSSSSSFPYTVPSALLAVSVSLLLYVATQKTASSPPVFYSIDVVNEYPHDPDAYTQGLLYAGNDTLYESTGRYQRSSIRHVHLQTGKVLRLHEMDGSLFGEGLTLLGERLFQVTWKKTNGIIYDRYNFSELGRFTHQMRDGWGLTTDGKIMFGSDGTSNLYHHDPISSKVIKRETVQYNGRDIPCLNEIEYVNGEVWANVWPTDCIARISHNDGKVVGWILLHELRHRLLRSGYTAFNVLNGIAWDEEQNRLFVTGKLWPKLYEIKLRQVAGPSDGSVEEFCSVRPYYHD